MLSARAKRNFYRVIPFGCVWLIFSIVYAILERAILGGLQYYPSTGNPYSFIRNLVLTPAISLVTGLVMGFVEVRYLSKLFTQEKFAIKILAKTAIYLTTIIVFLVVITAVGNAVDLNKPILDASVLDFTKRFILSYSFVGVTVYMASIILLSLFYHEVSESLGLMMLRNFFVGTYHRPIEEERIYLFLDMRSSTTIAENLGHKTYFSMLKEYYADLSAAIIDSGGEVYQYVGDEVVITWKIRDGLNHENCLMCFLRMKSEMRKQARKYETRYGLVPAFKAGLHLGKVTAGEIGVLKKEILFTGDVLNTTARIQELCNSYNVDLLLSGQLVEKLANSVIRFKSLGKIQLRGRNEEVDLFTVVDEVSSD